MTGLRRFAAVLAVPLLAVPGAHASEAPHDPEVNCSAFWRTLGVLSYAAAAVAPAEHEAPVLLTVTCTYLNQRGRVTATNTGSGYAVSTFGVAMLQAGTMTVCGTAEAWYADGHVAVAPERCWAAVFDV